MQLLQRRLRLVAPAAEDHEKIARLQFDLGQKPEALASVNKAMAITSDPDLLDELGQLRSKIEKQDRRARDHNKNRKKGR